MIEDNITNMDTSDTIDNSESDPEQTEVGEDMGADFPEESQITVDNNDFQTQINADRPTQATEATQLKQQNIEETLSFEVNSEATQQENVAVNSEATQQENVAVNSGATQQENVAVNSGEIQQENVEVNSIATQQENVEVNSGAPQQENVEVNSGAPQQENAEAIQKQLNNASVGRPKRGIATKRGNNSRFNNVSSNALAARGFASVTAKSTHHQLIQT